MSKGGWIVVGFIALNLIILNVWVFGNLGKTDAVLGDSVEKVIEKEIVEVKGEDDGCDQECVMAIVEEKIFT